MNNEWNTGESLKINRKTEPASTGESELCEVCHHAQHNGKCRERLIHDSINDSGTICPCVRAARPSDIDIEKKYLIALRWFKLFYNFYQKAIEGKPSAAMSAMSEDSELQELLREADRTR